MEERKVLADALERAYSVVEQRGGKHVLHTKDLSRRDRELLLAAGWLQRVLRGWYLLVKPGGQSGDTSFWYANFWDFLSVYLPFQYGENYCLSAESSLDVHLGETSIPQQVAIIASKGRGEPLELPFKTSLQVYASSQDFLDEKVCIRGIFVMPLPYVLCKLLPGFFQKEEEKVKLALQSLAKSDELLRVIVKHNFTRAAGRLLGAYRFLENKEIVEYLEEGFAALSIRVQEVNPFSCKSSIFVGRSLKSPYQAKVFALWQEYREVILRLCPSLVRKKRPLDCYLEEIEGKYLQDAYHSLSIEGFQVEESLIRKVRECEWDPEGNKGDLFLNNALAARGYYEAFLSVKNSLFLILNGQDAAEVVCKDLPLWYQNLFLPSVRAGIVRKVDLVGFRRHQVYIRNSRHVPFPQEALMDAMEAFFECLRQESDPIVRAVLGHFVFVFIHPYMDGNGRTARFLMNVLLISAGYPWTIVRVQNREQYLDALEAASTQGDIAPFARFIFQEMCEE